MGTHRHAGSPDGRTWDRWRRWGRLAPVVGLMIVAGGPASAESPELWNTTRVLEHRGNECSGEQNCLTIKSPPTKVDAGQGTAISVSCPPSHPHFAGWDTEQHEHLTATLAPPTVRTAFGEPPKGKAKQDRPVLTVLVTNAADAPGIIRVFVGCTEQVPRTTAVRRHRGAVPSNHPILRPLEKGKR
jgi:hypothetical protein